MRYFMIPKFVLIFSLFFGQNMNGQEYKKDFTREIEVKNSDSIIKAYVLISGKKVVPDGPGQYYWYAENKIHFNQSGIAGFPLHGECSVFDRTGKLISSGNFEKGLKAGEWKYWHLNGNIKRIENYKSGRLKKAPAIYDENGILVIKKSTSKFHLFSRKKNIRQDDIKNKMQIQSQKDSISGPQQNNEKQSVKRIIK